jgi:Ca2+-binding EF-hand superfamily protein
MGGPGAWGGHGAWGGMGGPGAWGGHGAWGGMGGPGAWGGHGAWGGMGGSWANLSKEEREKLEKEGKTPPAGPWGGPWGGSVGPVSGNHWGPWASGLKEEKSFWGLGDSTNTPQKNHWNHQANTLNQSTVSGDLAPLENKVEEFTPERVVNKELTVSIQQVQPLEPTQPIIETEERNNPLESARFQQGSQGFMNAATKHELLRALNGTMKDQRILETKRKNLAMRSDFCLSEIFTMIDANKSGYVNLNELDKWAQAAGVHMTREDWAVVLDRFDCDLDSYLSFSEFSRIFTPDTKEYKTAMNSRLGKGEKEFKQLTLQTKKLVRDLLYAVRTLEDNFENNKHRITGNSISIANEIFDHLDRNKDSLITLNEFTASLADAGVTGSKTEFLNLFTMFDVDKDGKVTFKEFHNPGKTAEVEVLHVL